MRKEKIHLSKADGMLRYILRDGERVGKVVTWLGTQDNRLRYLVKMDDGRTCEEPRLDWARSKAREMVLDVTLDPDPDFTKLERNCRHA